MSFLLQIEHDSDIWWSPALCVLRTCPEKHSFIITSRTGGARLPGFAKGFANGFCYSWLCSGAMRAEWPFCIFIYRLSSLFSSFTYSMISFLSSMMRFNEAIQSCKLPSNSLFATSRPHFSHSLRPLGQILRWSSRSTFV